MVIQSTTVRAEHTMLHERGIVTADEIAISMGETVGFVRRLLAMGALIEIDKATLPAALRLPEPLLMQADAEQRWDRIKHKHWAHRRTVIEKFAARQLRRREYICLLDIARHYAAQGDAKLTLDEWRSLMLDAVARYQFEPTDQSALLLHHRRPHIKINDVELRRSLMDWPDALGSAWVHRSAYFSWAHRNGHRINDQWIGSRRAGEEPVASVALPAAGGLKGHAGSLSHTGFPGAPTSAHLILAEFTRRTATQDWSPGTLKAEAESLAAWLRETYKPDTVVYVTALTVENQIRKQFASEKAKRKNPTK